jgi:large subunit ribosomal protein L34
MRTPGATATSALTLIALLWCNTGFSVTLREASAGAHQRQAATPQSRAIPRRISPMKRTYQGSKTRRARTHGFLVRMKSRGGRAVLNARRAKGRKRLAV